MAQVYRHQKGTAYGARFFTGAPRPRTRYERSYSDRRLRRFRRARRYGINEKTVRKWRSRSTVADEPMGPKERCSSVLSAVEEAAIVALRVQARLPLDDVFLALKDVILHLTRSSRHRCLQRNGISRLPKADREEPKRFKAYEIGYFRIDIAELLFDKALLRSCFNGRGPKRPGFVRNTRSASP